MTTEEHIEKTLQDLDNAICDLKNYSFTEVEEVHDSMFWVAKPEEELREVLALLRYRGDSFD
jgi:hypothetical protein